MTVFIFAGTGDGKKFIVSLLDRAEKKSMELQAHIFCATEYGAELIRDETLRVLQGGAGSQISTVIRSGRLNGGEMLNEITLYKPDYVIDCTHPFAEIVTKNIKTVCESSGRAYLRLRREIPAMPPPAGVFYVDSVSDAASFLKGKAGNIFLTTGSKELRHFSSGAFSGRVYPRVLPLEESLRACREAGIPAKNIIAMQGPFPEKLNRAVIRLVNASWLVSKESGAEGGFGEKVNAALAENCRVVAVRPPEQGEAGLDADTIVSAICGNPRPAPGVEGGHTPSYGSPAARKKFFPVFANIANKKFLIAGGGEVALRRLKTLLRFDCSVEIIAPEICGGIESIRDERLVIRRGVYREGDCRADFVIAATDDRAVNRMIAAECNAKNIPVSTADCKEESSFYFPALVCTDHLTVGITSDGRDHRAVSGAARRIRALLEGE
ncbi:MAG: precorrin-6A/cobalt-precorrin-6A reductase [Spirochaetaceae bacterium]|jgi:precorrin-2 dehydrogenase/sirohydrochlorin ferrochelatase/precorrin-6A/cobalt-precorrin-6A reductase|nr:precorrin-6A/cobalt-precorrin-6A reductase [Spirochaetaceae bacterium]